jgi:seryl-tRNA synthetase
MNTIENIVHYNKVLAEKIEKTLGNPTNEEQLKSDLKSVCDWLKSSSTELELLDKDMKDLIKRFVQLP